MSQFTLSTPVAPSTVTTPSSGYTFFNDSTNGDLLSAKDSSGNVTVIGGANIIVQTAAAWGADVTVYSDRSILVSSDVFYGATDQRKFKLADGVQTWTNLDYMPIASAASSLAATLLVGNTTGGTDIEVSAGDNIVIDDATASRVAQIGASKEVTSLDTATYPSLTELSYVKGVSSAIQTQINGKEPTITVLALANGGTNKNMTAVNGGIVWTDADSMEVSAAGTSGQVLKSNGAAAPSWTGAPALDLSNCTNQVETWMIACSDETTLLSTGAAKASFSFPYAVTVLGVYATVNTAPTGAAMVIDINEAGVSILSTNITIDISEFTGGSAGYQGTAATAAVISDSAIAAFAQVTIDIDTVGSTIAGKGLKVALIVHR